MSHQSTMFPSGLSVAILGREPDHGFFTGRSGNAVVLARVGSEHGGHRLARALEAVEPPEHLDTTMGSRAYAQSLAERLGEEVGGGASVDLLVMHREEAGLGGFCVGSVGVFTLTETLRRCTPDRTVGAQLRAMGRPVDDKTANLLTTRITAGQVHGGDVWYGAGSRFAAVLSWPMPDLAPLLPSLAAQDDSDALGAITRVVHRDCAHHSGLVVVWSFQEIE